MFLSFLITPTPTNSFLLSIFSEKKNCTHLSCPQNALQIIPLHLYTLVGFGKEYKMTPIHLCLFSFICSYEPAMACSTKQEINLNVSKLRVCNPVQHNQSKSLLIQLISSRPMCFLHLKYQATKNSSGMAYRNDVADNNSLPQIVGNITEMEHLKRSIDDVFVLSNGIVVCCE